MNSINGYKMIIVYDKKVCDSDISLTEVSECIMGLKKNKVLGSDGITAKFYKMFANHLATFLLHKKYTLGEAYSNYKHKVLLL